MDQRARKATVGSDGPAEWGTPRELFAALDRRFRFNYDPAASHSNRLIGERQPRPLYSTIEGTWVLGRDPKTNRWRRRKDSDEDGLARTWAHRRVFVNPPYSRGVIGQWTAKMANERDCAGIIVALLPVRTSERWWFYNVAPLADITYFRGRLRFEGAENKAGFASCLAVYRNALMDGYRP